MPRMSVVIAKRIELPATRLWAPFAMLASCESDAKKRSPSAYSVIHAAHGKGIGTIIAMECDLDPRLGIRARVEACLQELIAEDCYLRYELIDCGELPISDCFVSIRITPNGPAACSYKFKAQFYPVDESDDVVRTLMASHGLQLLHQAQAAVGVA